LQWHVEGLCMITYILFFVLVIRWFVIEHGLSRILGLSRAHSRMCANPCDVYDGPDMALGGLP
jgi:hypothetical protein